MHNRSQNPILMILMILMTYVAMILIVLVFWTLICGAFALFRKGHKDGRDRWYDYILLAPLLIFLKIGQITSKFL